MAITEVEILKNKNARRCEDKTRAQARNGHSYIICSRQEHCSITKRQKGNKQSLLIRQIPISLLEMMLGVLSLHLQKGSN